MNQELKARLLGVFLIAMGIGFAWYFVFQPLADARNGVSEVSYSLKVFAFVPFALISGTFILIVGARADGIIRDTEARKLRPVGWLLILLSIAVACIGYWWFEAQMATLGYQ